ncbi:MAG: ABC transporter substrate-binding protein [Planctomycetota bacterium]
MDRLRGTTLFYFLPGILLILLLGSPFAAASEPVLVLSSLDSRLIDFIAENLESFTPEVRFLHVMDDGMIPKLVRFPEAEEALPHVLYGVSTIALSHLADQGLLESMEPDWERDLPVGLADRSHRWYGLFGDPVVIVYNQQYFAMDVPESYMPTGWEDLGHPRFRGSLIIERPTPYNLTGYFFACLIDRAEKEHKDQNEGFELISRIDRNLLRTYDSRESLLSEHALFSGGDGSIAVAGTSDLERCLAEGRPANLLLPEEGLFLYPRGVALVKGASADAKRLYSELTKESLLREAAKEFACFPLIAEDLFYYSTWPGQRFALDFYSTDHDSVRRNIDPWISQWQNLIHGREKEKEKQLDDAINTAMTFLIPVLLIILILTARKQSAKKGRRSRRDG